MEWTCSAHGGMMNTPPHCHACGNEMKCDDATCSCECGTTAAVSELKCDDCLAEEA